jgi:hypothetical protein
MTGESATTRVVVERRLAGHETVARAALEMTELCYVWLERAGTATAVNLTERAASGRDAAELDQRFRAELDRMLVGERLERRTREVRSAIVGHALAKHRKATAPAQPVLDPETEAEIERLLAEIENDDWLEEAGEIAKTWEERFGVELKTCSETKKPGEEEEP